MDTEGNQTQAEGSACPMLNGRLGLILNFIFKVQSVHQTSWIQKPESLCLTHLTSLSIWRSTSLSLK